MNSSNRIHFRQKGIRILGFLIFAGLVLTVAVKWLWNLVLVPAVENVNPINYWQAAGLLILSHVLLGRFRFGPRGPMGRRSYFWREKWKGMSDQDRIKFREEWKKRCGTGDN